MSMSSYIMFEEDIHQLSALIPKIRLEIQLRNNENRDDGVFRKLLDPYSVFET